MRLHHLLVWIMGAALALTGCSDRSPVSSDPINDTRSAPVLSKKSGDDDDDEGTGGRPFTATIDLRTFVPGGTVTPQVIDGVLYLIVRDHQHVGPFVGGDFEGEGSVFLNADINMAANRSGPGWGTFSFNITRFKGKRISGTWEGTWQGQLNGILLSGTMSATGTGDLRKRKFEAAFSDPPTGENIFTITGRIVKVDHDD